MWQTSASVQSPRRVARRGSSTGQGRTCRRPSWVSRIVDCRLTECVNLFSNWDSNMAPSGWLRRRYIRLSSLGPSEISNSKSYRFMGKHQDRISASSPVINPQDATGSFFYWSFLYQTSPYLFSNTNTDEKVRLFCFKRNNPHCTPCNVLAVEPLQWNWVSLQRRKKDTDGFLLEVMWTFFCLCVNKKMLNKC